MTIDYCLNQALAFAGEHAKRGDVVPMKLWLAFAKIFSAENGLDLAAQVAELETTGYTAGLPKALTEASKYAYQRDVAAMKDSLAIAQECAAKIRKDINAEVADISALINQ